MDVGARYSLGCGAQRGSGSSNLSTYVFFSEVTSKIVEMQDSSLNSSCEN